MVGDMDIQQLEVFKWSGEDDQEAHRLAQAHFGDLRLLIDKIERDGETTFCAYAADQVDSLAKQVAAFVVQLIDNHARVEVKPNRDYTEFTVGISSREKGHFIGHHGATLDAVEMVISLIFNRQFALNRIIHVDVNGYRERRESSLVKMLKDVIKEIERDHKPRPIPNLLPKERKIVHQHLSNHAYLTTESRGTGRGRTLYIKPKDFDMAEIDDGNGN
jgi:spoIIIJ-associated protein